MTSTPIAEYALLSDRRTAALVSRDGSVDWLCAPRFDSPAVLGRLLDPGAGHWSVRPVDPDAEATRRYVDETMLLETTWTTATGTATVTDALATGGADDPHAIGAAAPRLLVRALECTGGEVEMALEFAPRPEYGLVEPLVTAVEGGVVARGGADVLVLSCPVALDVAGATASGRLRLAAGDRILLGVQHRTTAEPWPGPLPAEELDDALRATADAWRAWFRLHQNYRGPWRDLVHHSGRVLQALSYQPTGAVAAAATTSLPEQVGAGSPTRAGSSTATARRPGATPTASRARRGRSCSAPSGWPRRWPPARSPGPGRSSSGRSATSTTWAPGRGGRPRHRRPPRQLPAGLQPHWPDQRSVGDRAGRGGDAAAAGELLTVRVHLVRGAVAGTGAAARCRRGRPPPRRRAGAAGDEAASARSSRPAAQARPGAPPPTDRAPAHRARRPRGLGEDLAARRVVRNR